MMRCAWKIVAAFVAAGLLLGFAGLGVAWFGLYNVGATSPHFGVSHDVIHWIALRSISERAGGATPTPVSPDEARAGAMIYDRVCASCHGAPGRAPDAFAEGMNPLPPPLQQIGRDLDLRKIYWVTAHGIKMTGMPAFMFRYDDATLWAIAHFVRRLPEFSVPAYRAAIAAAESDAGAATQPAAKAEAARPGDPQRGRIALAQHGCPSCHVIPGLPGDGHVGPSLAGLGGRRFVAGVLENNDANLAYWIRHPQAVHPGNAMPDMRVSAQDARDIVAYLRELKKP